MEQNADGKPASRHREAALSKDGHWRSFPHVPCLLQYVSNGNYYGRIRVNGKLIRVSLKTSVWTIAKTKLAELVKNAQENRDKVATPKFSEAVELFKTELASDSTMKPRSKGYRIDCITKLQRTWPELWELRLSEITVQACKDWALKLNQEISSQYYNNMIGTLRLVIACGNKAHKEQTKEKLENPAMELKRTRVKQKDLQLPEPAHFKMLVQNLRKKSGGLGAACGRPD